MPVPTETQARETALFWRGIRESEGQGDTSHRALLNGWNGRETGQG